MNIMLFGAPAAGKGTQAKFLQEKYGLVHISMGDILRAAISEGTPMGMEAKSFIDKGQLVPDTTIVGIIRERLAEEDCKKGIILDGVVRTLAQADALEEVMKDLKMTLDKVISLNVPDNLIVARVSGRKMCKTCGASFHTEFNPSKVEGICDFDGGELYTRKDDTAETVTARLEAYHSQTMPLFDYYKEKGLLVEVDGTKDVSEVTADMFKALA